MPTPEEIAKAINPQGYRPPHGPSRVGKILAIAAFILFSVGVIGGGIYFLQKYRPSLRSADAPVKIATNIEDMGSYLRYRPASFTEAKVKRLVFVLPPGGGEAEVRKFISRWVEVAEQRGYLIASIVDWNRAKIIAFLQNARTVEGAARVYLSGFSNGGYNSCGAGLEFPQFVDGIIPMGAFCSTHDAVASGSTAVPILAVIGSQDTWALGDDGQLPYRMDDGLTVEYLIVPNIGHTFPTGKMSAIADWIDER